MAMGTAPSARRGRRHAPMADINVTPLVDVMLVLLIIFMVTAPLLVTGVPVKLPDSKAKPLAAPEKPTIISLSADGATYINEAMVGDDELADRVDDLAARPEAAETQIFLRADSKLDYGRVMKIMGELNRAGLNRIALVSTSEQPVSGRSR